MREKAKKESPKKTKGKKNTTTSTEDLTPPKTAITNDKLAAMGSLSQSRKSVSPEKSRQSTKSRNKSPSKKPMEKNTVRIKMLTAVPPTAEPIVLDNSEGSPIAVG